MNGRRVITLSLAQTRRWSRPQNWMVDGYSSIQEVYVVPDSHRELGLAAGGWTLSAADYLRIAWDGPADRECMYTLIFNNNRLYRGLWAPVLRETVTESFFHDGDLYVLSYRLLRVETEGDE